LPLRRARRAPVRPPARRPPIVDAPPPIAGTAEAAGMGDAGAAPI
jgi:hypothetical protein